MAKETVRLDLKLDEAANNLMKKLKKHTGYIGILSSTANKEREPGDPLNNAELAAAHEFGTFAENIPARSFFRLTEKLRASMMNAFIVSERDNIMKRLSAGQEKLVIEKLCAKWEEYLHECFETEGWGTWKPLSDFTLMMREKKRKDKSQGGSMILQDTGAMERSITFEVI